MQIVYASRTNLATNPNFEIDTTGWTAFDTTISRTTSQSYSGSASLQSNISVSGGVAILAITGLTVGTSYTAKVKIKSAAASTHFIQLNGGFAGSYAQDVATGGWDSLSTVATVATASSTQIEVGNYTTGNMYIDEVQLELTETIGSYFDGDSGTGYNWSGTRGQSSSIYQPFVVESADTTRKIAQATSVAWKKVYSSAYRPFTIGVSTIGGADTIASSGSTNSDWNKYIYENESNYVTGLSWERELNQPIGGVVKSLAEVELDNTSGRFTPRFAGGSSAIFTAVGKPRRPLVINAGFNYNGIDNTIPQFVGISTKPTAVDGRNKTATIQAADFIDYLQNRYVDYETMFTGFRSDTIIERILQNAGFSTAQYDLDYGINVIPFAEISQGQKMGDIIHKIVQAENGHFWQDENGILRFENRQHYDNSPYNYPTKSIYTAQVIEANTPDTSHLINVVEVKANPRSKQPLQQVWKLGSVIELAPQANTEIFVNFDDPMLQINTPSNWVANTLQDGTGTDKSDSVQIKSIDKFVRACKITFYNTDTATVYITDMSIYGRPAKVSQAIYYREQRSNSVTAYEEQPFVVENEYINDIFWAQSYAGMILGDYAQPENIQELTVRAMPDLQLGDLISWQGRYWRIYGIKARLDPSYGFIQDLKLLQRTPVSYFRIGISSIGGSDKIAP